MTPNVGPVRGSQPERDARDQSPTADRNDDRVQVGYLVHQLGRDGRLAGDGVGIVVGRHESQPVVFVRECEPRAVRRRRSSRRGGPARRETVRAHAVSSARRSPARRRSRSRRTAARRRRHRARGSPPTPRSRRRRRSAARASAARPPRTLNDPVGCSVSSFKATFTPRPTARTTGVGSSSAPINVRARRRSSAVGMRTARPGCTRPFYLVPDPTSKGAP